MKASDETARRARANQVLDLTIRGLPATAGWDWRSFKRWLTEKGINPKGIRFVEKEDSWGVGLVRFGKDEERRAAEDLLANVDPLLEDGTPVTLQAGQPKEYLERQESRKREREESAAEQGGRAAKVARLPSSICDVVCPLWKVPYTEQLVQKRDKTSAALEAITREVNKRSPPWAKPAWLPPAQAALAGRKACPLLGILRSPAIEAYRNKNEFTVGLDAQDKPAVGFLMGAFVDGITCVADPSPTRHTSAVAKAYAAAAAAYIRDHSKLAAYDKRSGKQGGFWRLVVVREGRERSFLPVPLQPGQAAAEATTLDPATTTLASLDPWTYLVTFGAGAGADASAAAAAEPAAAAAAAGAAAEDAGEAGARGMDVSQVSEAEPQPPAPDHVMVMLQVNDRYPASADQQAAELQAMARHLSAAGEAAGMPLTSVRVQYHSGVANAAPADAPIVELPRPAGGGGGEEGGDGKGWGPAWIRDALCELKFQISPTAFFQVNSPATCVLYKVVADWAAPRPVPTLLLDICCGTGTIGLTLAHKVTKVIGVDLIPQAIEDARHNAKLNGITNAEYVAGKAEDALPPLLAAHAAQYEQVVAIADPPRAGLHKSVVRALLACRNITRLVFVSCNPDSLVENVAQLCSPHDPRSRGGRGGYGGRGGGSGDAGEPYVPFKPVKSVAVDLFPHTTHVETIMLLERDGGATPSAPAAPQ